MKLKKNRLKFFLFLSVSILGLLCAILMPILEYLLFLVPVYGFALLYRFVGGKNKKGSKITKITLYSIVGVFLVGLLLFTINAQEGDNIIKSMVRQIPPLNKLFNGNDYVVPFKNVLVAQPYVFGQHEPVSFFDILFGRWNDLVVTGKDTISVLDTGSAFFDVVYEAGLVGALAIVAFIVVIINRGVKYLKSKESAANKLFIVSFIFIAFIYPIFSYMSTPKIHSFDYLSFFRSPIFFLTLFFVGRIFFDPKMEVINEK